MSPDLPGSAHAAGASETQPTLISLVPALHGGGGHVLGYHLSVGRAAALAGWQHVVLAPVDHGLPALPGHWQASLRPGLLNRGLPQAAKEGRVLRLIADLRRFADSIVKAIGQSLVQAPGQVIVFVEDFNGPQLLAIRMAMARLPRERLRFWLLYRQDPLANGIVGRAYARLTHSLRRLFPHGRLQVLADSEPLAQAVGSMLGVPVHVVPIPHTEFALAQAFPRNEGEIVCWWPGAPRPEKGLDAIRQLVTAGGRPGAPQVRLVLSEAAGLQASGGALVVQAVDATLSSADYQRWLHTADVILLPYDSRKYRTSTSGIFAECIAAGKIPLVSPGTWMAFELGKAGLDTLVLDWDDADSVLAAIRSLPSRADLRDRLARLREAFLAFHSEPSYAREMRLLAGARTTHPGAE